MVTTIIPEVGQLVTVRDRQWIVSEVAGNQYKDSEAHLVQLVSIEDSSHGEELTVLWDIEPGAKVMSQGSLPEVKEFDSPERLEAFLDAVRWGSIASADTRSLQSPYRSGISIEPYQLTPVNRALNMPRVNLLIADDVGLGKTIESGLIALELALRHRAKRMLIVCPPSLQRQWQDQMRDKFGLEFRIVDRALFSDLRRTRGIHVNPWEHFPRLITSIDFLKREQPMRLMQQALPAAGESPWPRRFDLLIVDEAHNIARTGGTGKYAKASDRTRTIETLSPHFEHKLFLSATPHNGYPESFSSLLELLDDQRFSRAVRPDPKQVEAVMIRRLKSDIKNWDGSRRFAPRRVIALPVNYSEAEKRAHELLEEYGRLRRSAAGSDKAAQVSVDFVLKTLKKRLFSSPRAFASTIETHLNTIEGRNRVKTTPPPLKSLRARLDSADESIEDDVESEDISQEALALTEDISPVNDHAKAVLNELSAWAANAADTADQKAEELFRWLDKQVNKEDERVIIFTEYRATQDWLFNLLASGGYTENEKTLRIHGGMLPEDREYVKSAFQADPRESPVRILLATDAAAEGLDLQNHCHQILHYEIPWNPNRLEQRNGRVDRHGQKAPAVLIYHFVSADYKDVDNDSVQPGSLSGDLEFLARAAEKVNTIRDDLGSAGEVLAQEVQDAMLQGKVTVTSLEQYRESERARDSQRSLTYTRDYKADVAEATASLDRTKDQLKLEPSRIFDVVQTALELAGQPLLQNDKLEGHDVVRLPHLSGSWGDSLKGYLHPYTNQPRPATFDSDVAAKLGDSVVYLHLNHPLVDRCARFLQLAIWGTSDYTLHRASVYVVDDKLIQSPAVIASGRLVITGGDGNRLHEQIIEAGGQIQDRKLSRFTRVMDVDALLNAPTLDMAISPRLESQLIDLWPEVQDSVERALQRRMNDRTDGLKNEVSKQRTAELDAITSILQELENSIRAELSTPETLQLGLFTDPEDIEQVEHDRQVLEDRLNAIPEELAHERAKIERKYGNTEPRLFPIAVTWFVPKSIAESV